MSIWWIATIIGAGLAVVIAGLLIYRRIPKRLKCDKFATNWRELQSFCKDKSTWPDAITRADNLLNDALKKRRYKGKTAGERLMSAQRAIDDNDQVWFAHKLYKTIIEQPETKLKEAEVKKALIGFRKALRDLGALPDKENQEPGVKNNEQG